MYYPTILVHLEAEGDSAHRLNYAVELARDLRARLIGFAAVAIPPLISAGDTYPLDGQYFEEMRAKANAALDRTRGRFFEIAGETADTAWRQKVGLPTEGLIRCARGADLVISGTPHGAAVPDVYRSAHPGNLVCGTGRPVLFAADAAGGGRPGTVVIGWKDTVEARRAVTASLGLLRIAEKVIVAMVADDTSSSAESVGDVATLLSRHGVNARTRIICDAGGADDELIGLLDREGADLIVSGAYGHSRLREWVFGGFTRAMLDADRFNRFMMA